MQGSLSVHSTLCFWVPRQLEVVDYRMYQASSTEQSSEQAWLAEL